MVKFKKAATNQHTNSHKSIRLGAPLRFILNIFYYMGLSSFSNRKFCLIHIVFVVVLDITLSRYHHTIRYDDNFSKLNDSFKFIVVFVAHLTALIETMMTRDSVVEFFRVYSKIHSKWSTLHHWKKELQIYGTLFSYLGFCIFIILLVEINFIIEVHNKPEWFFVFIAYMPNVFICRCRLLQSIMFMELIRVELVQLNREISHLAGATHKSQLEFVEDVIYKDLTQYMKRYDDIFVMCQLFKKSTAISTLVMFVMAYVKILSDCYWSYWVIYNQYEVYEIFECSLILPTAINIALVLVASKHCMRAAKLIPQSLHSIRHRIENLRLSRKIQNFSLQITYQQIIIDAFGCFVIDCYMASGILGSIATYMMFYIQFMPKFKNL